MQDWLATNLIPLVAQAEGGEAAPGLDLPFFVPVIIIGILLYFLLIRPERKRSAETADLLKSLKKNDHIVTIGGIYGTIVNVQEGSDTITIRVDENTNTKLRIRRSAVSAIVKDDDGEKKE